MSGERQLYGADFLELIYQCRDRDLSGLEFAAGIPGSVGGALYGNAGCYGQDIGSFTIECTHTTLDGAVVETMDMVRRAGIERLGMVTEPARGR